MLLRNNWIIMVAIVWLAGVPGVTFAQSDALVDMLAKKGLLTQREANEIKEQTFKETRDMFPGTKIQIGSWLDELKISGDVRLRYEEFFNQKVVRTDEQIAGSAGSYAPIEERTRFRYRLRLALDATAGDFKGGLRIASGENQGGANGNGDPISTNTSFDVTASHKPIYIDRAYLAYNPGFFEEMTLTGGKIDNPFFFSPLVYDADWEPEGAAELFVFKPYDILQVFLTMGQFVVEENARPTGQQGSGQGRDIFLFGEQVGVDWKIVDKKLGWKSAIALYSFDGLSKAPVTLPTAGNPLNPVPGTAAANVRESINTLDFNNQIKLGYFEKLPVILYADYCNNLADSARRNDGLNDGYYVGIKLGEAKKKGQWEIGYWYEELGANAFLDAWVDSDFGYGGANNKGHIVKAKYAVTDFITLGASYWFVVNRDDFAQNAPNVPGGAVINGGDQRHQTERLQFDAEMKF